MFRFKLSRRFSSGVDKSLRSSGYCYNCCMGFWDRLHSPLLAGTVLLLIAAAAVYFLYVRPQTPEVPQLESADTAPNVSAEVSGAVESPAEKLPETNPFSGYKNPFE